MAHKAIHSATAKTLPALRMRGCTRSMAMPNCAKYMYYNIILVHYLEQLRAHPLALIIAAARVEVATFMYYYPVKINTTPIKV